MKGMRRNKKNNYREKRKKFGGNYREHFLVITDVVSVQSNLNILFRLQNFKSTETNSHWKHGKGEKFSIKIIVNISKDYCAII